MRCKHTNFSLRVLSHEIVVIGKLQLMIILLSPRITLLLFFLTFLLGKDLVDILRIRLVLSSCFIVLFLGLLQNIVKFYCLLVEQRIDILFELLFGLLFGDLLLAPVLLL